MLELKNLHVSVGGTKILKGIDLIVRPGEVHAIMGPNGSGKSTLASVLAGRAEYEVTDGEIVYEGQDLLDLDAETRAREGLFLAFQYPVEIPGVSNTYFLRKRPVNEGFSGGEKKRNEIFHLAVLEPRLAILDETDSGLDIDALKIVAEGVNSLRNPERSFVLITHYQRLLNFIVPDFVHVLIDGRIVRSGGRELALQLEDQGYEWLEAEPVQAAGA